MNCRSTLTLMMATMAITVFPTTAFAQQKGDDAKRGTVRLTKAPKLKR